MERLSFLPEIGNAQALRGLVFPLVAHAGNDQNDDGDDIGEHFVQLLDGQIGSRGKEQVQDVQAAEQEGGQDAHIGTPDGENHEGDGKPAPVAEGVVGPDAAGVVHHIVQSAQTRDHTAYAGSHILILAHIDTGGIGGGGVLAHGPQVQAHPGPAEHIGRGQSHDHCGVGQKTVGQEDFAEPAQLVREGQALAEAGAGGAQGDEGYLTAGDFNEGAAEEVAEAHAEGGHGKAGNVLVGPEGYGEEAVQKPHEEGAQQRAQQGNSHRQEPNHILSGGNGLLIHKCADHAADTAHIHDAGNAQIQVAGLFRKGFAGGAEEQRDALDHGSGDKGYKIKHCPFPPFRVCGRTACRR